MNAPSNPWQSLEAIPGQIAFPAVWRALLGDDFAAFRMLCLQASPEVPVSFPCPLRRSCAQKITTRPAPCPFPPDEVGRPVPSAPLSIQQSNHPLSTNPSFVALCEFHPANCNETPLTHADITPLELSWSRLGRALCQAFGCNVKLTDTPIPNTMQIGSWSAGAVPVILTVQVHRQVFRRAIPELVARLRQPFIIFAPTSNHFDAACQELLANVNAGFFPLDSNVILTEHGALHPKTISGELFANFRPDPKNSPGEDVARQTLALAKALDAAYRFRKAPLYTVFLLYCSEGLTVNQIAKGCGCHRSVIFTRLKLLRQKLGRDPAELRQFSAHFEKIEASLSDPRARRIYRRGAIDGDEVEEA